MIPMLKKELREEELQFGPSAKKGVLAASGLCRGPTLGDADTVGALPLSDK